ncbi:MAG TPA: CHAT domain-containing tetratricopeptide repeat protein [Steroidobacteraceae bacterium]|nr:CHAT domain-containing tetratricopeptide repeat protein [Steroidobacteraceae bacterium]
MLWLFGCSGGLETEPLVEFSTELNVQGSKPQSLVRQLRAGVYVVEIRERDIDLRVRIDSGKLHTELADAYLRHGLHRTVVSLEQSAAVRITLSSIDQRTWRGSAALRILRWPQSAPNAPPDERLLGYMALGKGNELVAKTDTASWRAAIQPMRQAAAHFEAANDIQALAEAEYQRGYVEFNLLYEFEDGRRTAASAQAHFLAAGDEAGAARAAVLRALHEFNIASGMGPEVPRSEQRALLDTAVARVKRAQAYFEAHDMHTDAMNALNVSCIRDTVLGDDDPTAEVYRVIRARAKARGDKMFEVRATQNLAAIAMRQGNVGQAVTMFEAVLPLVERDRNPDMYATLISNLGHGLIALGEFDRALLLHTEALGMFSARGDDSQTARELAALASIQFRSGNVERALTTIESAFPLYERAHDQSGHVSALRLAGNAASELGSHDIALEYLRRAERQDKNAISIERTRVLIAGELRALGDLRGAEKLLAQVLQAPSEPTRADALAERARLRQKQRRGAEALADLREADAIYARLNLDFNRIDSSSALALALLAAGDVQGASDAADIAVEIETRIRVNSANPEMRARFLSASYAPYEARIETDLAGANARDPAAIWKAFRVAEAIRARSLADRLAHAPNTHDSPRDEDSDRLRERMTALQVDLERRMRKGGADDAEVFKTRRLIDEVRARLEARMLGRRGIEPSNRLAIAETREAVQADLPADTAVLAYFVGDQHSHAWLLTRNELRHSALPGRRAIQDLVSIFVERLRTRVKTTDDPMFAPLLGNLLAGVNAHRLLVLPDGPLNGLPFAALPIPHGRPNEMLIDRFVVAAAPSLALAMHPAARHPAQQSRVAVISDPVYTPDDRRLTVAANGAANYRGAEGSTGRLARLPYSAIEARAVVRAFAGSDVIELAGFNATARRVIELPSADLGVLHFATHAVARRDAPEQSALFLSEYAADGSLLPSDRLTVDDISRSGLRADIVVLSGCATGDGRELRGEGVLGLTYGFLANGSHTVIASLWPVEDALTARFMEEFYAAYRASGRASDALRTAQLRTRGTADSAVWSSFVVRANELP